MSWWLILGLFRRGLFLSQTNAFDLYTRQFSPVADRAVITFATLVFERDDFLVLALFDNLSSHLCSGDERVAVSHVFAISEQKYITKRGSFARFDVEQIDIDGVAFGDAKLPATSSDDCVSHSFSGEKKPATIPHLSALGKRKARAAIRLQSMQQLYQARRQVPNTKLRNVALMRPMKNCGPSRVSSASSKGAGRRRFDVHASPHPRTRRLNIRNTKNHNRCPLSDRNLR